MRTVLIVLGGWVGLSLLATLMYIMGAALGRRGAWEEGYEAGLRDAATTPELRIEHHQPADENWR